MGGYQMLTQQTLKEYLHYDPETGVFTWIKKSARHTKIGSVAGTNLRGYTRIYLFGKGYYAHTLAVLYMDGYLPECVDHKNHVTLDNRWVNLRACTLSENQCNRLLNKNNKSGVKGVYYKKQYGKWSTQITFKKRVYFFGNYDTIDEAAEVVNRERQRLHKEFANKGDE